MPGITRREETGKDCWQRDCMRQTLCKGKRGRAQEPHYTEKKAPEGHCHSLENKRNMIRDYGMFWSSVVEAPSLLSHLPIWSSPLFLSSSFAASIPLSSAFHASLTVLPWNICHTSIFNPFLPSALFFARQIHALIFCSLFPPPLTSFCCLCIRINSLRKCRNSTTAQ